MIPTFEAALENLLEHYRAEQGYDPHALIESMHDAIEDLEVFIQKEAECPTCGAQR